MMDAKSSGAELPAAMKVAPATSSLRSNFCPDEAKFYSVVETRLTATPYGSNAKATSQIFSSDGTKYSSHVMARARNM